MDQSGPVITVRDLCISFGKKEDRFDAVKGISFEIGRGRTLAVVGESGSGKSLTALALTGLLPKEASVQGTLLLQNTTDPLTRLDAAGWQDVRGAKIGMVFQEPMSALNPVMRVGKQLSEAIQAHGKTSAEAARRKAIEWMEQVQLPEPGKLYDRYPHQLSGGQKQRMMIAMAMCHHPSLLIADEPTTALDVTVQKEVLQLMSRLQQQYGTALMFITHDLALAAGMADEVLVLYKGACVEYGPASVVFRNPQHPYTQALLACRPAAQEKGRRLPVVADFLEHKVTVQEQPSVAIQEEVLLDVNSLRVWFPSQHNWLGKATQYFKAVEDVSFRLHKGEVLGLVGESGCGKSTLSKTLMGILPAKEGQVLYQGRDLTHFNAQDWRSMRREVQMIFQDPYASLNPRMRVGDIIREPLLRHRIVPSSEADKEVQRLLDLVQLPADSARRYPHQFSGGQRQRIGIARALALRPRLLICDESVSALDVSVQAQILNLLKDLQAVFDLSYLFISHDLSVVHYISDRVLVMQQGRIVETGDAEQVLKQPQHPYTQKLVAAIPEL